MKLRTCPNCGHHYSRIEYLKIFFFKTIWSSAECRECKEMITIDLIRRIIVAPVFGLWIITVNTFISYLDMNLMLWIIILSLFFAGTLFIFTFDTFKKASE